MPTRSTAWAIAVALIFSQAFTPAGFGSERGNIVNRRSEGAAVEEASPHSEPTSGTHAASLLRSRHLAFLGADRWHAAGFRGQGIKVAILDSGFRGYRAFLGRALPEHVTVHSCRSDGNLEAKDSIHGILCGEVVHALAPDAELLFANWEPDRPDQFIEAVRWARGQGARVLSCSLIMPSWSDGEGGGPTHAALVELLTSHGGTADAVCFASAGNTAQRHWSGLFHDGAAHFHEWEQGRTENELSPWGNEPVSVELCWQAAGDYDLIVDDRTAHEEVARSLAQTERERVCAVARFQPRPSHDYDVRVRLAGGTPGMFHLVALGGYLQSTTSRGSIPFPADGPEVIAVGAVDAYGHRAPYSSCGPNSPWPKPDLVALVPFPTICRAQSFSGTSAASPQAAATAALWWSKYPNWAATQIRHALQASAHDLGPPGHDYETGYGLISLP
ncbi:MAG TPA: S8 family serine peptidase [Gemmataceae bacterium]|nr:S8 family serine peptidase [Gemmataceae bacterium]